MTTKSAALPLRLTALREFDMTEPGPGRVIALLFSPAAPSAHASGHRRGSGWLSAAPEYIGLQDETKLQGVALGDRPVRPLVDGRWGDAECARQGGRIAVECRDGLCFRDVGDVHGR